jgi:hypothetical protein
MSTAPTINPPSFRIAFESQLAQLPPEHQVVFHSVFNALTDIYQSLPLFKSQIDTNKSSIDTINNTMTTSTSSETTVITANVIGSVNDEVGETAYSTQQSDYGAFLLFSDASAVAVTLSVSPGIQVPWYCIAINFGASTVTFTPAASATISYGTTFNASSMPLLAGYFALISYDGSDFWASYQPIVPVNTPAVDHEWLNSYDSATGAFTQTRPAFTDISGVAATDQIGTGTPSAGEYVDGGTGAWTALPSGGVNFVDDETVSGSGAAWTLAFTPAAGCVPILVVQIPSFGGVTLLLGQTPGFTISGANITTTSSYAAGALAAWYRR